MLDAISVFKRSDNEMLYSHCCLTLPCNVQLVIIKVSSNICHGV